MSKNRLTIGVLGAANIAGQFVTAVQPSQAVRISAVASRTVQTAQAFADRFGIAKAYATYDALLEDASIEAVYIPLPNHMHAPWAIKALQAGKHVLCEKPLCLSLAQAQAMFSVDISMLATLEFANGRSAQVSCAMNVANNRRATIMGTAGTIETEYLNHTSAAVTSQLRVRRGTANHIAFEDVPAAMGNGFKFAAEAFADVVRRQDFAAVERASLASMDIARMLEAIAQSARSGQTVML